MRKRRRHPDPAAEHGDVYDPMIPGDDVAGGDPGLAQRLEESLNALRPVQGSTPAAPPAPYDLDLRPWTER